jgi:PEP-utilising enzyme, mobile domain
VRRTPKSHIAPAFTQIGAMFAPVSAELVGAGRLERSDDMCFMIPPELRRAGAAADMDALVAARDAAPSTDPGCMPLSVCAGALVMERSGAMSHVAVVAREYGIPA